MFRDLVVSSFDISHSPSEIRTTPSYMIKAYGSLILFGLLAVIIGIKLFRSRNKPKNEELDFLKDNY
jgi:hypothetical protein